MSSDSCHGQKCVLQKVAKPFKLQSINLPVTMVTLLTPNITQPQISRTKQDQRERQSAEVPIATRFGALCFSLLLATDSVRRNVMHNA